ncbi:Spectrin beta chain, non-erythrocytic 5 [Chamberlinius hualienensis]
MDSQIADLQHQHRSTQIKVFTKWANSYLDSSNLSVNDLVKDMSDGVRLVRLIEAITGQSLGRINSGNQKFHRMDNVNKCITYLSKRFPVKGISAEDIVSGNVNSILALLWLIFANLQTSPQQPLLPEANEMDDAHHKAALLRWCQNQISDYPGVRLNDFSRSWSNGLAFNALIHRFRPELVNYNSLNPKDPLTNLNNAFKIAEEKLNIPRLLSAKDVCEKPDEDSIIPYIAYMYELFGQLSRKVEEKIVQKRALPVLNTRRPEIPKKTFPQPPARPMNNYVPEKPSAISMPVELVIFPDSWECNYCDFMNTPVTAICAMCYNPKPANAVSAKDKPGFVTKDEESDEHDFTEDEEILRRPSNNANASNITRVSITLESPEAIKDPPSLPLTSAQNSMILAPTQESLLSEWQCQQCGFDNPEITKICGACFLKK